jgi:beta-lactamase regulating signal transducer with metallopeptidase domain/protocatechuate 3,4-dioxygenase beta subunit
MFDTPFAQFAVHILLQTTLLIAAGFAASHLFARRKPVVQSAILRVTLIAVLLCPVASLAVNAIGADDYAILPDWETPRDRPSAATPPSTVPASVSEFDDEVSSPFLADKTLNRTADPVPPPLVAQVPEPPAERASVSNSGSSGNEPAFGPAAPVPSAPSENSSSSLRLNIGWIVASFWLAGTLILLTRLIRANVVVYRLRRSSREAEADVRELCRETAELLGVAAPETRVSPRVHSPCLTGLRTSIILLPDGETLSRSELRDVFLHELAHLSRRDCLFHLLARLATAVLFFQPLVWLLSRRLEQISDDICDDYVIQYGTDRKSYAHTLVNLAEQLPLQWAAANTGVGMVSLRSSLSHRVMRILDSSRSLTLRLNVRWILLIAVLGFSLTAGAALMVNSKSAAAADQDRAVSTDKPAESHNAAAPKDSQEAAAAETETADNKTQAPAFHFRGKVVDPEGNPVAQATINYTHWNRSDIPVLATANERGEFEFTIAADHEFYDSLQKEGGTFIAMAEGYGLAVKAAHECETSGEMMKAYQRRLNNSRASRTLIEQILKRFMSGSATFKLVKDDVPLTGRVVDIEGQPVQGAVLKVAKLIDAGNGGLDAWEEKARQPGIDYYALGRYLGFGLGNHIGGTTLEYIPPVITDAQGRFTFTGLGRDRIVRLLISGPGIASSYVYARTRAGEIIEVVEEARRGTGDKIVYYPAEFTHVAGPSLPVEGVVRDAETKQPIAGVTLQSYHLAGQRTSGWTQGIVQAVTDEQGHYRLEGLPIGDNEVLCLSSLDQPYIVAKFQAKTKPGGGTLKHDMELTRGIWIEGRAYDKSTGEPIRSGRVEYYAFLDNPHAKAVQGFNGAHLATRYRLNSDGTYRIPGLPGRGIVGVMADRNHQKYQRGQGAEKIAGKQDSFNGFRTYPYILSAMNLHVLEEVNPAEDAESVEVDFEFDSGRSLEVKVVDQDGKPVTGGRYDGKMEVFSNWEPFRDNTLTINGYRPDKPRRVQVFHKERKLVGYLVLEGKNPENLTVTVEPWGTISGRLLDESGVPKANVTIGDDWSHVNEDQQAAKLPPNINQETGQRLRFSTDEDGRFTIAGIVPGKPLELSVTEARKNGILYHLGSFSVDVKLKPGEVRDLGDVQLESGRPE